MRISCDMATVAGPPGYYVHQTDSGLHAEVVGGGPRWFRPMVPSDGHHESCTPHRRWYWGQTDVLRGVGTRPVTFFNEPSDGEAFDATPYDTLRERVHKDLRGDPTAHAAVFDVVNGLGPVLPQASDVLMMQGWMYAPDPITGAMTVHKNVLLMLNVSAIRSLANLIGGPDAHALLPGNSRGVLCFHRVDDEQRTVPVGWKTLRAVDQPHLQRDRIIDDRTYRGYDCRLLEPDAAIETPTPADHDAMISWHAVVRRLPVAEQVRLLAMALPKAIVETGFGGTEFERYL